MAAQSNDDRGLGTEWMVDDDIYKTEYKSIQKAMKDVQKDLLKKGYPGLFFWKSKKK